MKCHFAAWLLLTAFVSLVGSSWLHGLTEMLLFLVLATASGPLFPPRQSTTVSSPVKLSEACKFALAGTLSRKCGKFCPVLARCSSESTSAS